MNEKTAAESAVETPSSSNIFADLNTLRMSTGLFMPRKTEILMKVPVRRPNRQEYIRVNPAEDMLLPVAIYEDIHERETMLVSPHMCEALNEHIKPALLTVAINRLGVTFIWPVKLVSESGMASDWYETAQTACEMAKKDWIRVSADMSLGAYRVHKPLGLLSEPEWPAKSLNELLSIAFRGKVIENEDHPVVRRLRGLI